jgi:hypothetical protein
VCRSGVVGSARSTRCRSAAGRFANVAVPAANYRTTARALHRKMVQPPLTHEEAHAPQLNFTTRTLHFSLNTTFILRYIPDPDFSWEKYTYRNLDSAHNVRPEDSTTASGQILRPCFFAPTFGSLCCGRQARCRHHACSCRREARAHSCSSANPPPHPLHFSTFKQHYSRFALR